MRLWLLEALLDDPEKRRAYATNAEFHASIDALCELLPVQTALMARGAHASAADRVADLRLIERTPPGATER